MLKADNAQITVLQSKYHIWYYNQSTPARYVNQCTQWYFNGRTTHVAENCRGGLLKFILFLLIMP